MRTELQSNMSPASNGTFREQPETGRPECEARRAPRRPYAGRVTCAELGFSELAALDISLDGVGLLSPHLFKPGEPVTLYFFNGTQKVRGVVRRVRTVFSCDWQVGVEFLQQEDELIQAIESVS